MTNGRKKNRPTAARKEESAEKVGSQDESQRHGDRVTRRVQGLKGGQE